MRHLTSGIRPEKRSDFLVHQKPARCSLLLPGYKPARHVTVRSNVRFNQARQKMMELRDAVNTRQRSLPPGCNVAGCRTAHFSENTSRNTSPQIRIQYRVVNTQVTQTRLL